LYKRVKEIKYTQCYKKRNAKRVHFLQLFEKLKIQNPDYKSKCKAVEGDIIKEGLGLDQDQVDILAKEVSVIIHSAATIKFDEEMK